MDFHLIRDTGKNSQTGSLVLTIQKQMYLFLGFVTSDWWKDQNKTHLWSQYFIYFCHKHEIYTLYINLPNGTTLAADMREEGLHFDGSQGADFPVAENVSFNFPKYLNKYNWEGKLDI